LHVAIIMDGNGRWAVSKGLPRAAGHREGVSAVARVVEAAPRLGIGTLSLFAFSSDNWQRPEREVQWLMRLFREYLRAEVQRCVATGVRLTVIGRRDRLPRSVPEAIADVECATRGGRRLHLRLAVDYSARGRIESAARALAASPASSDPDVFARHLGASDDMPEGAPDVDLLIRAGGEQRLSDFLLWECAYAELLFTPCMWPDFGAADLAAAVHEFHSRERRFGALPAPPVPAAAVAGLIRRI